MSDPTDVLVVGAGPVGLCLAIDLARRGVSVQVVDTLAAPTQESRAIVVHSRTLDHFEALGVLDAVLDRSVRSTGMEMHSDGRLVGTVGFGHIQATHPYSVSLAQSDTEAVLAARLGEAGVTVERGVALTSYVEDGDGLVATLAAADGSERSVRARYLVGADGGGSTVRRLMGQRLGGSFTGEDVVLGDVEGDHDYERSHFHAFFSPGQTSGLLFPLRGERLRVLAQLPEGTDPHRPVTIAWVQELMDERGIEMRITRAHWLSRFVLKHGQVERYRKGRVFLAGDAAHIHSPAGALGMNTGIQDAVNLSWKLAHALRSGGAERLLDSYHDERHPVGAQVVALTTAITRVGTLHHPLAQRVRNTLLHFGMEITPLVEQMADTIEQQRVHYRRSPIVSGHGRALHPGDFLHLPETDVGRALAGASDHLVIRPPQTGPPGSNGCTFLPVTAADVAALEDAAGLSAAGVLVVRPDGYIGHIGAEDDVPAYLARLDAG